MGKEFANGEQIIEGLNWRYAVKQYDKNKKVSDSDWQTLERAMSLAPSSFGLQPYRFFVVGDASVREKLKGAAWGQSQITDASRLIVFAYKKSVNETDVDRFVDRICDVRGQERSSLADYENAMKGFVKKASEAGTIDAWSARQTYIPLGFLLHTAALLGIDATPMEGFDPAQMNEILGLTDYSAVVIAAVGYRDAEHDWLAPLPKVRYRQDEIVRHV